MTIWRRIFQRHRHPETRLPPVQVNQALRDGLARTAADGCSARSLAAVYRELLDAGHVYVAVLEGAERLPLGIPFTTGPEDQLKIQTAEVPGGGPAIIVHPDIRSASRQIEGGNVASIPLSEAATMALEMTKGLLLSNYESPHPSGRDWLFVPVEHLPALAAGKMPKI
jgi:hypothetical protein